MGTLRHMSHQKTNKVPAPQVLPHHFSYYSTLIRYYLPRDSTISDTREPPCFRLLLAAACTASYFYLVNDIVT